MKSMLILLMIVSMPFAYGQSDKVIAKATKFSDARKFAQAEKILTDYIQKNPTAIDAWDALLKVQYADYQEKYKTGKNSYFTVTSTTADGDTIENDEFVKEFTRLLNQSRPHVIALNKFLYTCRSLTAISLAHERAPIYLRSFGAEVVVDTNVSDEAWVEYDKAERKFQQKNYEQAVIYYKRALQIDSTFFKATLYAGDMYYIMGDYPSAEDFLKRALVLGPNNLEPYKYLTDTYIQSEKYEQALDVCMDGITVYPDLGMFLKLEHISRKLYRRLDMHWIPRGCLPNDNRTDFDKKASMYSFKMPENSPWQHYLKGLEVARLKADKEGIIESGIKPEQRYTEIFAWTHMLSMSDDPQLSFAKQMQAAGYLDCYVFISCFHHDIYAQFRDWSVSNKSRIREYIDKHLLNK